jgi:hypothetical protein
MQLSEFLALLDKAKNEFGVIGTDEIYCDAMGYMRIYHNENTVVINTEKYKENSDFFMVVGHDYEDFDGVEEIPGNKLSVFPSLNGIESKKIAHIFVESEKEENNHG